MTRDRWRDIRAALQQDIRDGVLEPGAKLPTEPRLAETYGAGRHSVRRAIAELAKEGLLSVEQGRGTYVQARPLIRYAIGRRTRLGRNMGAEGVAVSGEITGAEQIAATARIAAALGLEEGAPVVATSRITLGDGVPVSIGTIYHDATRFPDFAPRRAELGSTTRVYAAYGIADYVRGQTEIYARPARPDEARALHQHPDMPVLVVRSVDAELDGAPLSFSQVIWSAARVKFSVTQEPT